MLFLLPFVDAPGFKITLITPAMGYYAASFTPNIWSIIQSNVKPHAIGPASGIINGIGAGGGGTLAGLMVGYFYRTTGSYMQDLWFSDALLSGRRVIIDLRQNKSSPCPALAPSARM